MKMGNIKFKWFPIICNKRFVTHGVDDRIEGVGEVLEEHILFRNSHAKYSVEKLRHVIVAFV